MQRDDRRAGQDAALSINDPADEIERLRDQVSGVSLDEEASQMLRFQRAYEANARYFSTVDSVLATLLHLVGGA